MAEQSLSMSDSQVAAFWSKVESQDEVRACWEWQGARKPKGYGNVRINNQYLLAHRVAFELGNGPIPDGLIVCHICDNPSCCNPSHLMLGTTKSNSADMVLKNRQKKPEHAARGSVNGNSKLTEKDVLDIRRRYREGAMNQYELADQFGVTQSAVGAIVRGKTWRHVQ